MHKKNWTLFPKAQYSPTSILLADVAIQTPIGSYNSRNILWNLLLVTWCLKLCVIAPQPCSNQSLVWCDLATMTLTLLEKHRNLLSRLVLT